MYQNNSAPFTIICRVFGLWRGQCNVVHWIDLGIDLDALNQSPQFLKCYLFVIELKYLFFIATHFLQFIKSLIVLRTVLSHCENDLWFMKTILPGYLTWMWFIYWTQKNNIHQRRHHSNQCWKLCTFIHIIFSTSSLVLYQSCNTI